MSAADTSTWPGPPITCDPATWPAGDKIWTVCQAIAFAEGAEVLGDAPDRYNNPGDLSKGDEHGQAVSGYVRLPDGEEEIYFANKLAGWTALYHKIQNIVEGKSHVFSPRWTWRQVAKEYAGDSQDWVNNVTTRLGVSPDDLFGNYFQSAQGAAGDGS